MAERRFGADLHLHTIYSDGTYTPNLLVQQARRFGLRAIAVTDHDTIEGIAPVRAAAAGDPAVYSGVEFSVECGGAEVHILGLFVEEHQPSLVAALEEYQERRRRRIYAICERLSACGVALAPEAVFRCAGIGSPGRLHVARALVESGAVPSIVAAFDRYIGAGRPACVPKVRHTLERTLALIRQAGGLSFWAHPGLTDRDHLLAQFMEAGMDGIEAVSSAHNSAQERHYLRLARRHGLLVSGGSDCHGMNKDRLLIGSLRLSDRRFDALRQAREEARSVRGAAEQG